MYISEIREMEYTYQRYNPQKVLYLEIDKEEGYAICVIDRGGWPCTYIKMPEEAYQRNVELGWDGDYDFIDVRVHGGVTYGDYGTLRLRRPFGNGLGEKLIEISQAGAGYWLGWDYAHYGDYTANFSDRPELDIEKKWTIVELINEAHDALKELKENNWHVFVEDEEENDDKEH